MSRRIPGPVPGTDVLAETPGFDPVRIYFRAPTHGEKRTHLDALTRSSSDASFAAQFERRDALIKAHVTRIENYETPSGVPIKSTDDLCLHGEEELLVAIEDAIDIAMALTEEGKKKFVSLRDSRKAATSASDGIAESAESNSSAAPEIATAQTPTPTSATPAGSPDAPRPG